MQTSRFQVARFPTMLLLAALMVGCAGIKPSARASDTAARILALPPADVVLLGEQHDAAEHQRIHRQVVASFAERGKLAALVIEMAEHGRSTAGLPRSASESEVQMALAWDTKGWPWAAYGPAVMTAVRAGVPVLGANLQRLDMREAMGDRRLDDHLPDAALRTQRQAIRTGHCGLLPEAQIAPMTRIQIARDRSMARTIADAAVSGKVVLLLAGSGHVANGLGVPLHLPPTLKVRTVRLLADGSQTEPANAFDTVWPTPAVPAKDYCADMKKGMGG